MQKRKPITSDRSISTYKPEDKEYLVSVKNHPKLNLMVRPNDTKSWIYRYISPITGKPQRISLGIYPSISLAHAYQLWLENEEIFKKGLDPKIEKKKAKEELLINKNNKFKYFSKVYLDSIENSLKSSTFSRKINDSNLLCSYIGDMPIADINPPKMLEILLDIQDKFPQKNGKPSEKAERCASIASEVFTYALTRGYCTTNPAMLIKSQLASPVYGHRPAITTPNAFAKLLQDIESLAERVDNNTIHSLRLLPMLFVRNGDLRHMRWQDLDLGEAKWRLRPLKGEGKENMVNEMIIPLPKQAVKIFQQQRILTGHTDLVFYSPTARKHQIISENTANDRLKDLGYKDIHCVHGFRASAKTMLQEQLKYPAVLVEMALGHVTKDQNGSAYARFQFLEDRTEMMQMWADYLDALREGVDTKAFLANRKLDNKADLQALLKQFSKEEVLALLDINVQQ